MLSVLLPRCAELMEKRDEVLVTAGAEELRMSNEDFKKQELKFVAA